MHKTFPIHKLLFQNPLSKYHYGNYIYFRQFKKPVPIIIQLGTMVQFFAIFFQCKRIERETRKNN